jgi:hypothetical protein
LFLVCTKLSGVEVVSDDAHHAEVRFLTFAADSIIGAGFLRDLSGVICIKAAIFTKVCKANEVYHG